MKIRGGIRLREYKSALTFDLCSSTFPFCPLTFALRVPCRLPQRQERRMAVLRDDPYSSLSFLVVINGILDDGRSVRGSFAEVSGLDVEVAPIEYRNGSEDITVRKIP